MYIKLDENGLPTGNPITDENLVYILGDIINSPNLNLSSLLALGYAVFNYTNSPEVGEYQIAEQDGYSWDGEQAWQKWKVREMTPEEKLEIDARKKTFEDMEISRQQSFKINLIKNLEEDSVFKEAIINLLFGANTISNTNSTS